MIAIFITIWEDNEIVKGFRGSYEYVGGGRG
jgi:hypothetical protein